MFCNIGCYFFTFAGWKNTKTLYLIASWTFCFVSDLIFIMRRRKKGKFSPSGQHKVARNSFQNFRCQLWWNFGSLALPMYSMKCVVDKLNNSFTDSGHFLMLDKLFSHGENVAFIPILMMNVKYETKQIYTILKMYVWNFVESFNLPHARK